MNYKSPASLLLPSSFHQQENLHLQSSHSLHYQSNSLTLSSRAYKPALIMPFTLHPATVTDASDIAAIFQAAFAQDHIMSHFHPNVPAAVLWEKDVGYFSGLLAQGGQGAERVTKAVDEESG